MEKINNWEEIEIKGISDFVGLKAGAYKCKIINAEEYTNEKTGNKSLKVQVDIIDGEFKDYFQKLFDNNMLAERKWDNNATRYLGLEESGLPFLKGFITCIENSNPNYKWDWDETKLKDKFIGCIFSPEEYEKQDGTTGVKVRLSQFRSIDKLEEASKKEVRIRLLDGTTENYEKYKENIKNFNKTTNEVFGSSVEIKDEDLPFNF